MLKTYEEYLELMKDSKKPVLTKAQWDQYVKIRMRVEKEIEQDQVSSTSEGKDTKC